MCMIGWVSERAMSFVALLFLLICVSGRVICAIWWMSLCVCSFVVAVWLVDENSTLTYGILNHDL
jgi:hypothetical protein